MAVQLPGGSDARPPADDRGAWLHQHALPWPVGASLPQVRWRTMPTFPLTACNPTAVVDSLLEQVLTILAMQMPLNCQ